MSTRSRDGVCQSPQVKVNPARCSLTGPAGYIYTVSLFLSYLLKVKYLLLEIRFAGENAAANFLVGAVPVAVPVRSSVGNGSARCAHLYAASTCVSFLQKINKSKRVGMPCMRKAANDFPIFPSVLYKKISVVRPW